MGRRYIGPTSELFELGYSTLKALVMRSISVNLNFRLPIEPSLGG